MSLLICQNNDLFLRYFKKDLKELINSQLPSLSEKKPQELPDSFWVNHVSATFVETVRWWIENGMKESPETLAEYFMTVI